MGYLRVQLFQKRRFKKLLYTLVLISCGSALIIAPLESFHPESKIKNLFDGVWWVVQTVTTIGYGDYVPVSVPGKVLGLFLQIVGSTLYSILFVVIGSTLSESTDYYHWNKIYQRLDEIDKINVTISRSVNYLVKHDKQKDHAKRDTTT